MKVRLLMNARLLSVGDDRSHLGEAGALVEVSDQEADALIALGSAVAIEEKAPEVPKAAAPKPLVPKSAPVWEESQSHGQ